MKSKKILLIGPFSPPITGVSICNDKIYNTFRNKTTIKKINTSNHHFSEELGSFSFKKLFTSAKHCFQLYKIFNVDIVYITIGQTFFGVIKYLPFLLISRILRKKNIIHVHGNFLSKQYAGLKGLKKKLFKYTLKLSHEGIVLSNSLKDNLRPFLSENKIHVIYNFVDNSLLELNADLLENKFNNEIRILYLSNLMTEKGIFDLLSALEILEDKKIKYKASIAGNIDLTIKEKILSKIDSLEFTDYLGVVKGERKKEVLISSNVFVFPTYYKMEGQPISLLEAMATANIVLTTNHAGIKDIFSEKNGFFIEKKSPESIVEKLILLQNNKSNSSKFAIYNHNYIKQNFTEQFFLSSLLNIFNNEAEPQKV